MMNHRTRQFCTVYVDSLLLGIDVQQIQEVLRYQGMTRVPLAPKVISGLINLRGQIVTAIDMRHRLGLPLRGPDEMPMNVVVRDGDNMGSLLVDRIGDVLEVNEDLFEPTPPTFNPTIRSLIIEAYKLPERLLLVLDTTKTLVEYDTRPASEPRLAS